MKLKIKNKKIILEDNQYDLKGVVVDPLTSVGKFLSSSVSLTKDLTKLGFKIGWAGIVNSISPNGSWNDFKQRVKDSKKSFDDMSKKTLSNIDSNTREMIRNAGLREEEIDLILAGGAPAIFLTEKLFNANENNSALSAINKIADIEKDSSLDEGYQAALFRIIFIYFLQKKPSSAEKKYTDCYPLIESAVSKFDGGDFKSFINSVCKNNASIKYKAISSIFSSIRRTSQREINQINENTVKKVRNQILTGFAKNTEYEKEATNEEYKNKIRKILVVVAFIIIKDKDFSDIVEEIKKKLLEGIPEESRTNLKEQSDIIEIDLNSLALVVHYNYSIVNGANEFLSKSKDGNEEASVKAFISEFNKNVPLNNVDFTTLESTRESFLSSMKEQVKKDNNVAKELIIAIANASLEEFDNSSKFIRETVEEYEEIKKKLIEFISDESKESINSAQNNLKTMIDKYNKIKSQYNANSSSKLEKQTTDEKTKTDEKTTDEEQ
jgi:hypothetical protein